MYRNKNRWTEAKDQWDRICNTRQDIKTAGCSEGSRRSRSGVPPKTLGEERVGQVGEKPITTWMIDQVSFVMLNTRLAWRAFVTLSFPTLTVGAGPNDPHQGGVSALFSC